MLDPFLQTQFGNGTTQEQGALVRAALVRAGAMPAELLSYNSMITKAPRMVAPGGRWTVWGAAYGAAGRFTGDAVIGSNNLKISSGNFAVGVDYRVSPDTVLGVAVSGGTYNYGLDALGSGRGELVQVGVYGSTRFADRAYLSGALSYGRHDLAVDRNVAFGAVFDRLSADFNANSWGGRIESGYRFAMLNGLGITPFAAVQAQRFETPAYAERDLGGLAAFALNYAAQTTTDTRTELGTRFDYRTVTDYGALLTWRGRVAWGHEFSTERSAVGGVPDASRLRLHGDRRRAGARCRARLGRRGAEVPQRPLVVGQVRWRVLRPHAGLWRDRRRADELVARATAPAAAARSAPAAPCSPSALPQSRARCRAATNAASAIAACPSAVGCTAPPYTALTTPHVASWMLLGLVVAERSSG